MAKGIWWMVLKAQTQLDSQDPKQGTISLADGYAVVPLFRDKKEAEKHSDNGTFQILQVVDVITNEEE